MAVRRRRFGHDDKGQFAAVGEQLDDPTVGPSA
jgi:hypothetical protein